MRGQSQRPSSRQPEPAVSLVVPAKCPSRATNRAVSGAKRSRIERISTLSEDVSLIYLYYACFLSPLPLLAIASSRSNRLPIQFSILTFSAVLFPSAIRGLKLALLGGDSSHRLFMTIGVNIFLAMAVGLYWGIKRTCRSPAHYSNRRGFDAATSLRRRPRSV
jgi:hypothetical protein